MMNYFLFPVSNINLALNKSLDHLNDTRPGRFQAVYFLTDGFQSTTDVKTNAIISQVKHINKGRNIPIFTLALGSTSDVILLRAVAAATGGKFKKIYERQLSYAVELMVDFFGEINTHLLNNLTLKNCDKDAHRFDMSRDYYRGSENIFYITPDCFPNNNYQMVVVTGRGHNGINNYTAPLLNSDLGLYNDNQKEEFLKSYLEFLALRTAINMDDKKAIRAYPVSCYFISSACLSRIYQRLKIVAVCFYRYRYSNFISLRKKSGFKYRLKHTW